MPNLYSATTTAQMVMDAVAQDVRQTISSTVTPGATTLLDYTNRVSLEMLRASRWEFLLSPVQRFITQLGVNDYWIGATGGQSFTQYDTGLNLTDIRKISDGSVWDVSNFRSLNRVKNAPEIPSQDYPDDTDRLGRPSSWLQEPTAPNALSIYPGPDNQNNFSPQPTPAIVTTIAGGSLPARMYAVTTTFVDSLSNESTAPRASQIYIPANQLLVVAPPQEPLVVGTTGVAYNRYNVYAQLVSAGEEIDSTDCSLQNISPVATTGAWTEPTSGLIATGPNPPSSNSVTPIDGYIIEFRYYRQRTQITLASQVLQIPDDYKDIVISGVLARTLSYLIRPQEAQQFFALYREGLTEIVRDINFNTRGGADYITPDAASVGDRLPTIETSDLGLSNF